MVGAIKSGTGADRIIRSKLSPLTGIASRCARRDPGSPPAARPIARWLSASRTERCALEATTPGSRSANIRTLQAGVPQRKRRTLSVIRTIRPCQGRSRGRRS